MQKRGKNYLKNKKFRPTNPTFYYGNKPYFFFGLTYITFIYIFYAQNIDNCTWFYVFFIYFYAVGMTISRSQTPQVNTTPPQATPSKRARLSSQTTVNGAETTPTPTPSPQFTPTRQSKRLASMTPTMEDGRKKLRKTWIRLCCYTLIRNTLFMSEAKRERYLYDGNRVRVECISTCTVCVRNIKAAEKLDMKTRHGAKSIVCMKNNYSLYSVL